MHYTATTSTLTIKHYIAINAPHNSSHFIQQFYHALYSHHITTHHHTLDSYQFTTQLTTQFITLPAITTRILALSHCTLPGRRVSCRATGLAIGSPVKSFTFEIASHATFFYKVVRVSDLFLSFFYSDFFSSQRYSRGIYRSFFFVLFLFVYYYFFYNQCDGNSVLSR